MVNSGILLQFDVDKDFSHCNWTNVVDQLIDGAWLVKMWQIQVQPCLIASILYIWMLCLQVYTFFTPPERAL
jgi:hypothetical protein